MVDQVKNVSSFCLGFGSIKNLDKIIYEKFTTNSNVYFFIDEFFKDKNIFNHIFDKIYNKKITYISTENEPTTAFVNNLSKSINNEILLPDLFIGIGGGITLDITKAISNLSTNNGNAEKYQGWDLLQKPGKHKIGIPTISGTGAEATKTCVMINKKNGLKLGMNSKYTVFDEIILDPNLTKTVSRDQYFYTGMDAYIHCIESLSGSYRNLIGDAYSEQCLRLCREVFLSDLDMMSDINRMNLMVASYLGGCAIAISFVGLIHPLSSGLSVVLGTHHCISNCMVMRSIKDYYPVAYDEFWKMVEKQNIYIPTGLCKDLTDKQYDDLYNSTIIHEKPLENALGKNFKKILTKDKVVELFKLI